MISNASRALLAVCVVSSLVLAVSYVLPLSEHRTYLRPDGSQAGVLGQLLPDPSAASAVTYERFSDDTFWLVPVIFFLPVSLCLLLVFGTARVRRAVALLSPFAAAFLLLNLAAMVSMADFGINLERAYGAWVAVGAMGGFALASLLLAVSLWSDPLVAFYKKVTGARNFTVCS